MVFSDPVVEVVGIEPATVAAEEERRFTRADFQERPALLQVTPDPKEGLRAKRGEAVLAALHPV